MKKYDIKNLIFIIPVLLVFGGYAVFRLIEGINPGYSSTGPQAVIRHEGALGGEVRLNLDVATSVEKQWLGLSHRESLQKDSGMLFVFPNKQVRTFVMRNMLIPLDIIWIEDNRILSCSENLPPEGADYKERYSSRLPVNYVLEVNAGFCLENKVKAGDKVELSL